jgi:hypothetical protein
MKSIVKLLFWICIISLLNIATAFAVTKTSAGSGNWNTAATWSPSGVPASADYVIIATGHTVIVDATKSITNVTVNAGGALNWPVNSNKTLTVTGNITNNGTMTILGDISLSAGKNVTLGNNATLTWDPNTNTAAGATLFTNGIESYSASSNLIIKKWYDYTVPLGSVVSCNFGNLTLNSIGSGNSINEWNQSNWFQTRIVQGTFTVDIGWITLDKSGAISNTTFNNVSLTSINSYLYGHSGTHSSSFTINASSITNSGGTIIGLHNGNGNITMNVTGNFTNSGNIKLINNGGVANVSNGNATITVGGTFSQTAGDTRFIYNVTTLNSGVYTANFNNLTFTGGILMGQTGVNVTGGLCALNVTNDLSITFSSSTDKFRGISMTTIGSTNNNAQFQLNVGGNMMISGQSLAEYTSSASSGIEATSIGQNLNISGGTNSHNFGAASASHNSSISIGSGYTQTGGTMHFSRFGGTSNVSITSNLSLSSGTLTTKASIGNSSTTINGNFSMSGGTFLLHNNTTEVTSDPCIVTVNGTFSHSGGTINFDDNTSNLSATHQLILNGPSVSLTGTGVMTHAGPGTSTAFGLISFADNGIQQYTRATSHSLSQVKQRVENNCTLSVISGSVQVASHATAGTDYFRILNGARVEIGNNQFQSNALFANTGIQVDSGGTLALSRISGLYDGTLNAVISSNGNMEFFLHGNSTIEYNGLLDQTLTGTGVGIALGTQHQYGRLKIALQGAPSNKVFPVSNNVFIRTQLELEQGELFLNANRINVLNGSTTGIIRNSGYVKSETNAPTNTGEIAWANMQSGTHVFPFGVDANTYIPVSVNPNNGVGNTVRISTRHTDIDDNQPLPPNVPLKGIPSIANPPSNAPHAHNEAIDRWWSFDMPASMSADITLSYVASENSLPTPANTGVLGIGVWTGNNWNTPAGYGTGTVNGIGTVSANNLTSINNLVVTSNSVTLPIQLLTFTAKGSGQQVALNWSTAAEINNDYFTVERSNDGENFESIGKVDGSGTSSITKNYSFDDLEPLTGISYYRLKQTDFDGHYSYSDIRAVTLGNKSVQQALSITQIGPNPFEDRLIITLANNSSGTLLFEIVDATGKSVFSKKEQGQPGTNSIELNGLSSIESGTYLLRVTGDGQMVTKKVIKR